MTTISTTSIIMVELFVSMPRLARGQTLVITVKIGAHNGYKIISESVQNVLACKYIAPTGIEVVWASVQNDLACKCISPMGIEVIWASLQKVLSCKYIAHTDIEVVWASVQNVLACKYITSMGIEVDQWVYRTFLLVSIHCTHGYKSCIKDYRFYVTHR